MGVWLIIYDVLAGDRASYLDWFHGVHIPEKLARPGYDWAVHYEGERLSLDGQDSGSASDKVRFVAIFGARSTRVFYDPSPAQLKLSQDDQTREMIACRLNVTSFIATTEWSSGEKEHIRSDTMVLSLYDPQLDDQAISSWLIQDYLPAVATTSGYYSHRKLLSSTGVPRHMTILEFSGAKSVEDCLATAVSNGWEEKISEAFAGARVWPTGSDHQ